MRFIIVAPSYNENKGGALVLHKLCHLLNSYGHEAWLFPYISESDGTINGRILACKRLIKRILFPFTTNPHFNTPIIRLKRNIPKDIVAIYPEIINGNPLNKQKVVRWFLHHPGYHTGSIKYGINEFYISYKSFGRGEEFTNSHFSKNELTITHFFNDVYNTESAVADEHRTGSAYCMRKGVGRKIVHDLKDSILIDGMSHQEIALIFKRTKYFYCYDQYTAYFWFSIMCGCIPVVIPLNDVSKTEWYPNEEDRLGIAYGIQDIDYAVKTRLLALNKFAQLERENINNINTFVDELKFFLKINY